MTGDHPGLAACVVLALAGAQQNQCRQGTGRTGEVDDRGTGEIHHRLAADVGEQAAAPDRMRDQRVDHRAEDRRVDDVGAELDPLQGGAPDDRQRDRAEGEPVEHQHRVGAGDVEGFFALPDRLIEVEEEPAGPEEVVAASFGDPVAERPPGDRHDREVDEDLGHSGPGVLLSREADLEEHEAGLHQEDQNAGDRDPDHVQLRGLFTDDAGHFADRCGGRRPRQHQGGKCREQCGQPQLFLHRTSSLPTGGTPRRSRFWRLRPRYEWAGRLCLDGWSKSRRGDSHQWNSWAWSGNPDPSDRIPLGFPNSSLGRPNWLPQTQEETH